MRWVAVLALVVLAACETTTSQPQQALPQQAPGRAMAPATAQRAFAQAVARVEPVAERECRRRKPDINCDFRIEVDTRPNQPPNAFQTLDENGRPLIVFTTGLIRTAYNTDELAFVLGHEAAHHIAGHLQKQATNAMAGAVIFAGLATLTGATGVDINAAQELGAFVGARSYSKEFELEADRLGTVITYRAGYDPLKGAQFFTRIPDPGNRFLGSHPPNAERYTAVVQTMEQLR